MSILNNDYKEIFQFINEGKLPIIYIKKFREFAIKFGKNEVVQQIYFCPWTGVKLPNSLRGEFFDEMAGMGLNYYSGDIIPEKFHSEQWWIEKKL